MNASPKAGLAFFLQNPEPGQVKTRLSSVLGPERAARFYLECALLVLAKALRLSGVEIFVFFTPANKQVAVESTVMARFDKFEGRFVAQVGSDPGSRYHHALEYLHAQGFHRQVVLGTDSPTMPFEFLERAIDELDRHDCVVGPVWDGGYYLIGTRQPDKRMFAGMNWGMGNELGQTYDNITALGWNCLQLPRWQGVDDPDDLPFLKGQVRHADYRRLNAILQET